MMRTVWPPVIDSASWCRAGSCLGIFSCFVGVIAYIWGATGTTPAWVYNLFGTLGGLSTRQRVLGIPIEFAGLVWFSGLALVTRSRRRCELGLWPVIMFGSAVVLTAVAATQSWRRHFGTLPPIFATAGALLILVFSAREPFPAWHQLWPTAIVAARRLVAPRTLFALTAFWCIVGVAAVGLRAAGLLLPPREAADRNFLNWYASRPKVTDARLRQNGSIQVTVFTDYQCGPCGEAIKELEARIDTSRRVYALPVEINYRDYPFDRACNPAHQRPIHPTACEAAAVLRFVRERRGLDEWMAMRAWFYGYSGKLTAKAVRDRVTELGFFDEYARDRDAMYRAAANDAAFGRELGVFAPPAIFVDGVPVPLAYLSVALESEAHR